MDRLALRTSPLTARSISVDDTLSVTCSIQATVAHARGFRADSRRTTTALLLAASTSRVRGLTPDLVELPRLGGVVVAPGLHGHVNEGGLDCCLQHLILTIKVLWPKHSLWECLFQ